MFSIFSSDSSGNFSNNENTEDLLISNNAHIDSRADGLTEKQTNMSETFNNASVQFGIGVQGFFENNEGANIRISLTQKSILSYYNDGNYEELFLGLLGLFDIKRDINAPCYETGEMVQYIKDNMYQDVLKLRDKSKEGSSLSDIQNDIVSLRSKFATIATQTCNLGITSEKDKIFFKEIDDFLKEISNPLELTNHSYPRIENQL